MDPSDQDYPSDPADGLQGPREPRAPDATFGDSYNWATRLYPGVHEIRCFRHLGVTSRRTPHVLSAGRAGVSAAGLAAPRTMASIEAESAAAAGSRTRPAWPSRLPECRWRGRTF